MNEVPSVTNRGITFFPVPKFDNACIAFGADLNAYFPDRHDLPEVPEDWINEANRLFYKGGPLPEFDPRVDRTEAGRAVHAWLRSWGPSHEQKEATVGYAFWVWTSAAAIDAAEQQP